MSIPTAILVALRFAGVERSAAQKVESYYKQAKLENPGYSDAQAWKKAWSRAAGYSYEVKEMSVLLQEGRRMAQPFNVGMIQDINKQRLDITAEGVETSAALNVAGHQSSGPLTHAQEKAGMRREVRVDIQYPVGDGAASASAHQALQLMKMVGQRNGYKVTPCSRSYQPQPRTV